jgi:hypothetical protein
MMGWIGRIERMGKENAAHACRMFRELSRRRLVVWTYTVGLLALLLMLSALAALPKAPAPQDWTRFGYTASASRDNDAESRLTTTTVVGLHLVWRTRLPDIADSTPCLPLRAPLPGRQHAQRALRDDQIRQPGRD